jgi:hypothetical protein
MEAGCFGAQGFYFSRPKRPESMTELLETCGANLTLPTGGDQARWSS